MATMNPNIILQAGQTADILGAMQQGNALAQATNQQRNDNALAGFLRDNGAALMNGDSNALAQYMQHDPQAAFGMQRQMQMDAQRAEAAQYQRGRDAAQDARADRQFEAQQARYAQQDQRADQEWQWKVAEYAAKKSQQEREAEAAQIEDAVKIGLAAQSPEQWDALVTQAGAPDLVGQFDSREAIANQYMEVSAILKGQGGDQFRPASVDEAGQYGAQAGQFGPDGRFYPVNPPSGMSVETGPDGQVRVTQGPGVKGNAGKPLTEAEGRNTGFLIRAQKSGAILDQLENTGTNLRDRMSSGVPVLGNYMVSDDYQKFDQGKRDFVNALLRRESGAVITPDEFANADKQYFPQPGDSEEVIAQKRSNRASAIAGLRVGSGRGVDSPEAAPEAAQDISDDDLLKKYGG